MGLRRRLGDFRRRVHLVHPLLQKKPAQTGQRLCRLYGGDGIRDVRHSDEHVHPRLGVRQPDSRRHFLGHTLVEQFGHLGMYIGTVLAIIGIVLVVLGWKEVYKRYWSKEEGKGELITDGIYRFIRHPQYTGFMLITLGMLLDWATLPMLIMWPVMAVLYYRLARREEREMQAQFGEVYSRYLQQTSMFIPLPKLEKRVV